MPNSYTNIEEPIVLNRRSLHIFFLLLFGFFILACEKSDDAREGVQTISQIKILDEPNIANAHTVVAGDGNYLLLYSDVESQYFAKFLTNDGAELWTKNLSDDLGLTASDETLTIEEVLYDIDGTFAFFFGQRLIRLDTQGEVVYDNPTFTSAIPDASNQARILDVFLTSDGGYMVSGSFRQNVSSRFRAYFSKYSRTGTIEFSELFFINTGGHMGITSGIENQDGYTLGGYYSNVSTANKASFYILKISVEGDVLWNQIHETTLQTEQSSADEILGRELIQLENGNMMYFMIPQENALSDQRSKGYIVNPLGTLVDSILLDLDRSNILASARPSIGKGIIQRSGESFEGLVNPRVEIEDTGLSFEFPLTYETPNHGYSFSIDAVGTIQEMKYLDQSLDYHLACIEVLSDNRTVVFGVKQSIDNEIKLITVTNTTR